MAAIEQPRVRVGTETPGPDGIPADARRPTGSPRQVLAVCVIGAAILAPLAAPDLPSWAERLGSGPIAQIARDAAETWSTEMARAGLASPHEALRRGVRWLIERQWF